MQSRADTDAALARGLAFEGQGRLEEAAAVYGRVLVVRPESVRAWVNLGNVAADLEQRQESETAYRRALEIAPDDQGALNNLAWLLLTGRTRLKEAEALATQAVLQPGAERPLALDTLGRIQLARGRCAEAAAAFREALAAASLPAATRTGLGEALRQAEECRPR